MCPSCSACRKSPTNTYILALNGFLDRIYRRLIRSQTAVLVLFHKQPFQQCEVAGIESENLRASRPVRDQSADKTAIFCNRRSQQRMTDTSRPPPLRVSAGFLAVSVLCVHRIAAGIAEIIFIFFMHPFISVWVRFVSMALLY